MDEAVKARRLFTLVVLTLASACTRERARVPTASMVDAEGEPADFQQLVERSRTRLTAEGQLALVEAARDRFLHERGRLPSNLVELVNYHVLPEVPQTPAGMKFLYDPATGTVRLVPERLPVSDVIATEGPEAPSLIRTPR